MAYYKLRMDIWCDCATKGTPTLRRSLRALTQVTRHLYQSLGDCHRGSSQDIEDEAAMRFFGEKRALPT